MIRTKSDDGSQLYQCPRCSANSEPWNLVNIEHRVERDHGQEITIGRVTEHGKVTCSRCGLEIAERIDGKFKKMRIVG